MNVDLGIWNRLTHAVLFLLVVAMLVAISIWYLPLIEHNQRLRKIIFSLQNQIQQEQTTQHRLHDTIASLQNDPKTLERIAREKLGYARPGETVIRFDKSRVPRPGQPANP